MAGKGELSDISLDGLSGVDLFDAERGGGAALKLKMHLVFAGSDGSCWKSLS